MFWTGFTAGVFVGTGIGIVVAGIVVSMKRNEAKDYSRELLMRLSMKDEIEDAQGELSPLPKPVTYLDRYPHS